MKISLEAQYELAWFAISDKIKTECIKKFGSKAWYDDTRNGENGIERYKRAVEKLSMDKGSE